MESRTTRRNAGLWQPIPLLNAHEIFNDPLWMNGCKARQRVEWFNELYQMHLRKVRPPFMYLIDLGPDKQPQVNSNANVRSYSHGASELVPLPTPGACQVLSVASPLNPSPPALSFALIPALDDVGSMTEWLSVEAVASTEICADSESISKRKSCRVLKRRQWEKYPNMAGRRQNHQSGNGGRLHGLELM